MLLPLSLYFQDIGLSNTYTGLIWVYQLICLPLILWIVRGYFEDSSPDVEYAYRVDGHSWWAGFTRIALPLAAPGIASAGLLAFIFAWNNFVFALVLASADKQPVTVGALAFVTASGIQYGQIAAAFLHPSKGTATVLDHRIASALYAPIDTDADNRVPHARSATHRPRAGRRAARPARRLPGAGRPPDAATAPRSP